MDQERFLWACAQVMEARPGAGGIGTLKEKTLHAALKLYLEPDPLCREVGVGRFVADIVNPQGIMEIQTGGFGRLREKLDFFLKAYPVTVVYPVAGVKWLISMSQEGAISRKRKSPKPGGPWEILPELYRIRPLLGRPGLGFSVPVLEVEEYRLKDGQGRRGYTRYERMPVRLLDEVWVLGPGESTRLLPPGLPEEFTAKDFCRLGRFSSMAGSLALSAARELGAVEQIGMKGRAYVYRTAK
ncbi:MAG: hypothetical protein HFE94_01350 [Acutalibacter sp.]|nr:hypothetical protein [Acutalibacter sp.]